ncbi:MAG: signal recognition particle-docking protein FtsY [Acidobacteriota bacterium]
MKFSRLFRSSINEKLEKVFKTGKERDELFENIEEQLILSDISAKLVDEIVDKGKEKLKSTFTKDDFLSVFKEEIHNIFERISENQYVPESILPLSKLSIRGEDPEEDGNKRIIFLVGVNGSGKTTTAAKLAKMFSDKGKKVLLSASDTFRAAGSSQLSKWGDKLNIPVIAGEMGTDPGSVVFNSVNSFVEKNYDVLIVDTAGRVQTKDNLMRELEKLTKIVKKFVPGGPDETFLIIDATMGHNTLDQAKKFREFSGISGIILSKVDGTAKGGAILSIVDEMKIPVKYMGTGETESDIEVFSVKDFIDSLVEK